MFYSIKILTSKFQKIKNWEYWPSYMFYIPNLPYAIYLAIKAKNPVFYSAANPAIKSSGNGTESKFKTLQLVPEPYKPKSILITPNTSFFDIENRLQQQGISFPLIAKPDIGFRGLLVKKVASRNELQDYLKKYQLNIILQEFLDHKNECGIFYHRLPNSQEGYITSITLKKFLTITPDGHSTLKQLICNDSRAKLYSELLFRIHKDKLNNIPKKGKNIVLTSIGNHCKGTQFINGNHLISKNLEITFDKLSHQIHGWYYGRLDIKYNTFEELEKGVNFKVLEINGIISEPTHIYDSQNFTYSKALKTIRAHWKSLFNISILNNKLNNIPYKKTKIFVNELIYLNSYVNKIKKNNE